MNATQNFNTNETFNPLFAKMKERFCANGTIAEQMATEAGLIKKRAKKVRVSHRTAERKEHAKSSVFSLKNFSIASMCVLFLSVLFFSGASINGIQKSFSAESANVAVMQNSMQDQHSAPADAADFLQDTVNTVL